MSQEQEETTRKAQPGARRRGRNPKHLRSPGVFRGLLGTIEEKAVKAVQAKSKKKRVTLMGKLREQKKIHEERQKKQKVVTIEGW